MFALGSADQTVSRVLVCCHFHRKQTCRISDGEAETAAIEVKEIKTEPLEPLLPKVIIRIPKHCLGLEALNETERRHRKHRRKKKKHRQSREEGERREKKKRRKKRRERSHEVDDQNRRSSERLRLKKDLGNCRAVSLQFSYRIKASLQQLAQNLVHVCP